MLDVKWGTPTPIQLQDPKYNVFVPVRAFGQFGIRISDSKVFLNKLVGTLPAFNSDDVIKYFRGVYLTKVKDDISSYLVKKRISILEINAYINEISESLKEEIAPVFSTFGIELENFYVNDISVPENDGAVAKLKNALAKKAEMDIMGYNYTQERSFDTLDSAAKNEGAGAQFMGAGMGLGMGLGLGGNMGHAFGDMASGINIKPEQNKGDGSPCPECGVPNPPGTKYCSSCGKLLAKVCSNCGEALAAGQKFCPNCGTPVIKKCVCGNELTDNTKFCPECGRKVDGADNE